MQIQSLNRRKPLKSSYIALVGMLLLVFVTGCEDLTDALSSRDRIVDTWKCDEVSGDFGSQTYYVNITSNSADETKVKIENFYNISSLVVNATVNTLSLSIPSQTVGGYTISGSGTISAKYDKITLTYTVNDGGGTDHVTATYSK